MASVRSTYSRYRLMILDFHDVLCYTYPTFATFEFVVQVPLCTVVSCTWAIINPSESFSLNFLPCGRTYASAATKCYHNSRRAQSRRMTYYSNFGSSHCQTLDQPSHICHSTRPGPSDLGSKPTSDFGCTTSSALVECEEGHWTGP